MMKLLTRLGYLIEEDGVVYMARTESIDPDNVLAPLQAASSTWRIAMGPRAGRKVLTIIQGCGERSEPQRSRISSQLCANAHGFSLHAGVRCDANDRQGIEQLARYITRPAIANERLSVNLEGQVVLKLNDESVRDFYRAEGAAPHVLVPSEKSASFERCGGWILRGNSGLAQL